MKSDVPEPELHPETWDVRLTGGHRLLVERGPGDYVVGGTVEFFGDVVPAALFDSYLPDGWLPLRPTARPTH
jgi:hypothetical protein